MTPKESAFQKISELVERFDEQYHSYIKPEYNETLMRLDFIDKILGYCENRINEIVYQLYGLTEEEIRIVEGNE